MNFACLPLEPFITTRVEEAPSCTSYACLLNLLPQLEIHEHLESPPSHLPSHGESILLSYTCPCHRRHHGCVPVRLVETCLDVSQS